MTASAILLSDDLIFTSRISGTARALGLNVRKARSAPALEEMARQEAPRLVLLDLSNPGLDIAAMVGALKSSSAPYIVAYGSHVDTATLRAARAAGCDLVLPRSKFVDELPTSLAEWFARGGAST